MSAMERADEKIVLVVDDEPDVRNYLRMILEDAGFRVVTAGDGIEALDSIRRQKPDFISLDLIMPRKSGHKLLFELKRDPELKQIPVLIVTAHARTELGKKDLDDIMGDRVMFGPATYLEKPINPSNYVRCVQRALGLPLSPQMEERVNLKQELQESLEEASPDALRKALAALRDSKKPEPG
jgi:CheY-like chemotaxis protein